MKGKIFGLILLTFIGSMAYASDKTTKDVCNKFMKTLTLTAPNPKITKELEKYIDQGTSVVSAAAAKKLSKMLNISEEQLMIELIPLAKRMANPPVSEYFVGVVGKAAITGDLIFGVNLEFPDLALNQTVHGEQFMIARAMTLGEKGIESLALSAAPCGHCRQFLNETNNASDMNIFWPTRPIYKLKELLPDSFGPLDLGEKAGLLATKPAKLLAAANVTKDALFAEAFAAAQKSYAPYSKNYSGVAIKIKRSKKIIAGSYLENAAFNPSLSPLQVALVNLVAEGFKMEDIQEVALVEAQKPDGKASSSQYENTIALLRVIAPESKFKAAKVDWK